MKKSINLSLLLLLLASVFVGCDLLDSTTDVDDNGSENEDVITSAKSVISTPTVWEEGSVKVIDAVVQVNSTLTIEPGCVLRFTANGGMDIGKGSSSAALIADGTPDKPITFTTIATADGQAGSWYGLYFGTNNVIATSVLNNCIIEGAGKNAHPVVEVRYTKIAMDSCIIRKGAAMGIAFYGTNAGFTRFANNSLGTCADYLLFGESQFMLQLDTTNTFTSLNNKYIALDGGEITANGTLRQLGVPYTVLQPIRVNNAELTIEPGCILKFTNSAVLEIGSSQHAALIAEGTAENPIVFTSASFSPQPGDWNGLIFYSNNSSNRSILRHVEIAYAGRSNGSYEAAITAYSGFTFINSIIHDCLNYGVVFDAYSGFVACTNNTVTDCTKDPIFLYAGYAHTIGADNIIEAGEGMGIHVSGSTIDKNVTWLKHTMPYIMEGQFYVETNTGTASLTLNPGCELRFMAGSGMSIDENAKLVAIGTEQDSIVFTSNAQSKSPGDWEAIDFWQDARATNELKYCRVEYGGSYTEHNIGIYTSNVKITHSVIGYSEVHGIYIGYDEPHYNPVIEDNEYTGNLGPDVFREE